MEYIKWYGVDTTDQVYPYKQPWQPITSPSPTLNKPKKLWAVDEEQIHVCYDYSPAYRFLHS
jgi:hypothetical protein